MAEIQNLKSEIQFINAEMQVMKADIQNVKTEMQGMKAEMQDMKADIQNVKTEMQDMKSDLQEVKQKAARIELVIENEIRVNIKRVAEGHLDLSRNLHDALKIDGEKEMLSIRVTMLEADVKNIKERMQIA